MLRSFNKTASLSAGVLGVYVHTGPFCLRLPVLEVRSLVGARLRVSSAVSYGRNKAHAAALVSIITLFCSGVFYSTYAAAIFANGYRFLIN